MKNRIWNANPYFIYRSGMRWYSGKRVLKFENNSWIDAIPKDSLDGMIVELGDWDFSNADVLNGVISGVASKHGLVQYK